MILKNKIYTIFLFVAGIFLLTACPADPENEDRSQELRYFGLYMGSQYPDAEPEPSGLYYIEHKEGTGNSPEADDWVLINYVASFIPTEVIFETSVAAVAKDNNKYEAGALYGPYKVENSTLSNGVIEGLQMMKEGGQSIMCFDSDLGYGSGGLSKTIPGYQSLKYEIELLEVIEDIEAYEQARISAFIDTIPGIDTIHDPEAEATSYYAISEPTSGNPVVKDSVIEIAYKGYLIDGRVFDQRDEENPFILTLGKDEVISGWDLGLPKFKEGEKGVLVITYPMAYGFDGRKTPGGLRAIPPQETLVFDIEVIDVRAVSPTSDNPD